jgi:hypothetical protein
MGGEIWKKRKRNAKKSRKKKQERERSPFFFFADALVRSCSFDMIFLDLPPAPSSFFVLGAPFFPLLFNLISKINPYCGQFICF